MDNFRTTINTIYTKGKSIEQKKEFSTGYIQRRQKNVNSIENRPEWKKFESKTINEN